MRGGRKIWGPEEISKTRDVAVAVPTWRRSSSPSAMWKATGVIFGYIALWSALDILFVCCESSHVPRDAAGDECLGFIQRLI